MTMTTSNVPQMKGTAVADAQKAADTKTSTDKPAEKPAEKKAPALARAGESSDAGVQQILAEREIHAQNGDDDAVAKADDRLADLGYTV